MLDSTYVTVKEMREIEKQAMEKNGISASVLMENAGRRVAEEAERLFCENKEARFAVFSGYGNNGGDGMVCARYLLKNGYEVSVFLVGKPKQFSIQSEANYKALQELNCPIFIISDSAQIDLIFAEPRGYKLIVDAIFGIGIKRELEDFYLRLIDKISNTSLPVISIDVPSGLCADTGETKGAAIKASETITFKYPKIGYKNPNAKIYLGKLIIADIGF